MRLGGNDPVEHGLALNVRVEAFDGYLSRFTAHLPPHGQGGIRAMMMATPANVPHAAAMIARMSRMITSDAPRTTRSAA